MRTEREVVFVPFEPVPPPVPFPVLLSDELPPPEEFPEVLPVLVLVWLAHHEARSG